MSGGGGEKDAVIEMREMPSDEKSRFRRRERYAECGDQGSGASGSIPAAGDGHEQSSGAPAFLIEEHRAVFGDQGSGASGSIPAAGDGHEQSSGAPAYLSEELLGWFEKGIVESQTGKISFRTLDYWITTSARIQLHLCQTLTEKDSFLRLTGPSRAIVAEEIVCFEIELKLRGTGEPKQDRILISKTKEYSYCSTGRRPRLFSQLCTIDFSIDPLHRSIQATVLSVCLVDKESWPYQCGGRVVCSYMLDDDQGNGHVVLLDSHGRTRRQSECSHRGLLRIWWDRCKRLC